MTLTNDELKTRWVYDNDKGGISIVIPADAELTLDEIKTKSIPTGISTVHTITVDDIPTDRTFRDAWTYTP